MFFSVNVYSYLLPNGEELLSQADELFKKLLDDFHRCIAVNEIRPGLIRCDRQLRDYIAEFNFRFTKGRGSKSTAAKRSDFRQNFVLKAHNSSKNALELVLRFRFAPLHKSNKAKRSGAKISEF
jgi:hypothetical protein